MDTDGNKVTWVVIIVAAVAIMGGLFVKFVPNIDSQMQAYAQTVIGNFRGSNSGKSSGSDEDDNSPFTYRYDTNAKTATITGYNLKSGDDLPAKLEIPAYKEHNGVKYTVTSIGESAFSITSAPAHGFSVTLPNTIKTIGAYAFYDEPLTSINLPEGLVSIGNNAFYNAELTNVTIPSTLETMDTSAFSDNSELTSVDMSNATSLTSISDWAFGDTFKLASLKLPLNGKLSSIGDQSFEQTALTKIEIPASVTKIGYEAFTHTTKGVPVIIHSPKGAITYAVDDQGTTSTTQPPSTFAEVDAAVDSDVDQ